MIIKLNSLRLTFRLEASKTNYALYQNSTIPSAILLLDWDLSANEQQIAKDMFEAQFRWVTINIRP